MTTNDSEPIGEYYYLKGMNEANEKKTAEEKRIDDILQLYLPDDYYEEIRHKLIPLVKKYVAQETAALREELEQLRWINKCSDEWRKMVISTYELKEQNERLKEVVKELLPMCNTLYVDMSIEEFNAKIENAKKLTGQI